MFGKVTVQIKLVEGDSAGTVTAFYVSKALLSPSQNKWHFNLFHANRMYIFY